MPIDKLFARATAGSWKSSAAGAVVLLFGVAEPLLDGEPLTRERCVLAVIGLALLFVRDNDRTSEQVGASQKGRPNDP